MRVLLCCVAIAYGCDARDGNERLDARANPNLTVEPITIDAGVPRPAVKRASIGDHRRREDEDARERRREKARRQQEAPPAVNTVNTEAERQAAERQEAERRRLTESPLEVLPPRW